MDDTETLSTALSMLLYGEYIPFTTQPEDNDYWMLDETLFMEETQAVFIRSDSKVLIDLEEGDEGTGEIRDGLFLAPVPPTPPPMPQKEQSKEEVITGE